ncbi:hypothetical protein I5G24_15455 [Pseudomonas aeruginosa]|uniref:Uncharacterized protein n=1 Tax=Stutzerimonas stutzeri (strain A1501) TaxID=379731 RepID=A4VH74_STUS1|nr:MULTISPECIES: hypothetical protein [Pseudomonadaceae]SAJ30847.1 Uncharacterised protein [Enterobacter cloacae]ABP78325.1 conserved hypothetical protein [Stutzerimonas stutzeri A1501]ELQ8316626.1 hypothetical protein [Pseudomonas aeruginosa]MBG6795706.1 hypothetical protein [Pseudomonas aeruginosa]MBG6799205.1 hypothetical protein [Pseudomonas aeruginosa]
MEFRYLGNGQYFPPIAPNGRVYAVPFEREDQVEIFYLTSEGIVGVDVQARWSEIVGFYYDDDSWEIIPRNYFGRGMRFRRRVPCLMVIDGRETCTTHILGYPIPSCVMNRVAFEQRMPKPDANLGG